MMHLVTRRASIFAHWKLALAPAALLIAGCSGGEDSASTDTASTETAAARAPAAASESVTPERPAASESVAVETPPAAESAAPAETPVAPVAKTPIETPAIDPARDAGDPKAEPSEAVAAARDTSLEVGDGPRLDYVVGDENHHFGNQMEGATLLHTFDLTSAGTSELIIKQVKPTCGCTIAKVMIEEGGEYVPYGFGDPIPPGKNLQIGATLHTKGKRGHQKSRINIMSNDPRGTIQLGLEAEVEAFFTVNPQHLAIPQMTVGEEQEHVVKINTSKGEKIALDVVLDGLPKGMAAELRPIDPDSEGRANRFDLYVKVGPDVEEGSIGHTFSLRSSKEIDGAEPLPDGSMPVFETSVSAVGRVVGMVSFQPAYIAMGLVRPGQVATRTVRVNCHDRDFALGEPTVRLAGVSTDEWEYADSFSTVVRPVDGENAVDVEVRLDGLPEDANGSFRGRVIIEVNHPTKKSIELPITGVCRGGVAKPQFPGGGGR